MLGSALFTKEGQSRLFGNWTRGGFKAGYDLSFRGAAVLNVPMAAFSMATAPRGHGLSVGVEGLTMGAGALLGGMMFGVPGAIVGGILGDQPISRAIATPFQMLHDFDRRETAAEFGPGCGAPHQRLEEDPLARRIKGLAGVAVPCCAGATLAWVRGWRGPT